jgi:hypothetical protein
MINSFSFSVVIAVSNAGHVPCAMLRREGQTRASGAKSHFGRALMSELKLHRRDAQLCYPAEFQGARNFRIRRSSSWVSMARTRIWRRTVRASRGDISSGGWWQRPQLALKRLSPSALSSFLAAAFCGAELAGCCCCGRALLAIAASIDNESNAHITSLERRTFT